jgi:hypothetical protein
MASLVIPTRKEAPMNKRNWILAAILALQLVAVVAIFWPRGTASSEEAVGLFPGLETDRIVAVTITEGDGSTLRLAKQAGGWVLPEAGDYPVQDDRVPPLLDKIVALEAERLVTQTGDSHKRLKVAQGDFERRIELELADGTRHELYVGSSPSYGAVHVRAGDQDQVYLTSEITAYDADTAASRWVDSVYFTVPEEELVALTLENSHGVFQFAKDGDTWTMEGLAEDETFDEPKLQALVGRVNSIPLLRPLGQEELVAYGMKEPNAVVTVKAESEEAGERTYTLRVGAQDPEDASYVVISSESPYYVRVSEYTVKDFVENAREGFLVVPPTATPEATPTG